ncbi:MAG: IgGFc-binding protein, partial [Bacteroidales bacterium]|nr:IgGFc-binding protein [Bacteroidales bacterium]
MTFKRLASIILAMLLAIPSLQAQLDTEFWFAVPEVNRYHWGGSSGPGYECTDGHLTVFHITTLEFPATVTISMPANETNFNGGKPVVLNIPANTTHKLYLHAKDMDRHIIDPINIPDDVNKTVVECISDRLPNIQSISVENRLMWAQSNYPAANGSQYINRNNKGLLFESDRYVAIYYEISVVKNRELLVLKGKNALGSKFYVPMQTYHSESPYVNNNGAGRSTLYNWPQPPYRGFDIVAVENNTHIKLTVTQPIFLINNSASTKNNLPKGTYDIWLNRGETAIIAPYSENEQDYNYKTSIYKHLSGSKIEVMEGKQVAIQVHDDMVTNRGGGSVDYVADQIVPVDLVGTEYAVIRGYGASRAKLASSPGSGTGSVIALEHFVIVATENNTNVSVTMANGSVSNYSMDELATQQIVFPSDRTIDIATVKATKPVYVFHQSGVGTQYAGSIVPTISVCTGSTSVAFDRTMGNGFRQTCELQTSRTQSGDMAFFLNILVYEGAEDAFVLLENGVDVTANVAPQLLPENAATTFKALPGATGVPFTKYKYARLDLTKTAKLGVSYIIKNSKNVFHLGIINGSGNNAVVGGAPSGNYQDSDAFYGYFSDFAEIKVDGTVNGLAGDLAKVCYGDVLRLYAQGGTTY